MTGGSIVGMFNKKMSRGGIMDVIRCDEPSYLVWKWHPVGTVIGNNSRENSIRWGSRLRVKEGSVAVFVYKKHNGVMQDYIVGPCDTTLNTDNLPILSGILGLLYNGDTPFQAEVYFINLAEIIQIPFGVPYFDVFDPRFLDFSVPVAVRGRITFRISDYKEFVKLHRLEEFNLKQFSEQIYEAIVKYIKTAVTNAPIDYNIPVVQLERKITEINEIVFNLLGKRLENNFGVTTTGVDIAAIEIDRHCEEYGKLMAITQDVTMATVKAQTENAIELLRIQREESQYATHMSTQSANIVAHQINKQAEVGIAGADSLGKMAASGEMGSSGMGGFNPAAMIAGMAVGGALGQNVASAMNGVINQPVSGNIVPHIPNENYYIVHDGNAMGPYSQAVIIQMLAEQQITTNTLVWRNGMTEWKTISEVSELKNRIIPPIPQ